MQSNFKEMSLIIPHRKMSSCKLDALKSEKKKKKKLNTNVYGIEVVDT